MIQKSRTRLLSVGSLMIASIAAPAWHSLLWAPAIILSMTGVYLVAWAIWGHAAWCRNCKRFNLDEFT